jgi:hypothetical protein
MLETAVPSPTTKLTVGCWFKPNAGAGSQPYQTIIQQGIWGTSTAFNLQLIDNHPAASTFEMSWTSLVPTSYEGFSFGSIAAAAQGVWMHAIGTVTYGVASGAGYVNGVLVNSGVAGFNNMAAPNPANSDRIHLAAGHFASGYTFEGSIAELFVAHDTITADQARALYKGYTPLQVMRKNNLKHYWPLIGGSGPAIDVVGKLNVPVYSGSIPASQHPGIIRPKASRSFSGWRRSVASSTRIFPVSDITDGGWTDQAGGSNITDAIDEIDASNYAVSSYAPVNDPVRFQFPSAVGAALPFKVSYAIYAEGTTRVSTTVNLYSAGILIATWLHPYTGMALEVFEQYLTSAQFAAITNLADLEGEIIANENDDPISILGRDNIFSWYDAQFGVYSDDGAVLAVNFEDNVKHWKDKLQPHRNVVNRGGTHPAYDPVGINGYPSIYFDRGSRFLKTNTEVGPIAVGGTPSFSLFVVQTTDKIDTRSGRPYVFGHPEVSGDICFGSQSWTNYPEFGVTINNYPATTIFSGLSWDSHAFVQEFVVDGEFAHTYLNSKLIGTYDYTPGVQMAAAFGATARLLRIGHTEAAGDWLNAKIGEIILAKGAATSNQLERLRNYFYNKWDIARDPRSMFGTDLVVWLDAYSEVDPNGSGALANNFDTVVSWEAPDLSSASVSQNTSGNRPMWRQRCFNGKHPGVVFDGVDNYMRGGLSVNLTGANSLACFVVGQMGASTSDYGRVVSLNGVGADDDTDVDGFCITRNSIGSGLLVAHQSRLVTKDMLLDSPCVMGIEVSPNLLNVYVDNEAGTPNTETFTPAFDNSNTLRLGTKTEGGDWFSGIISEVVMLKRLPTEAEREELHEYFRQKWKLHNPKHIMGSDLVGWYDARDGVLEATSDPAENFDLVAQWSDRSGNGNHITEATIKPSYYTSGLRANYPSVKFSGGQVLARSNVNMTGSEAAVFVAGRVDFGVDSFGRLVSLQGASADYNSADGFALLRYDVDPKISMYQNSQSTVAQNIIIDNDEEGINVFAGTIKPNEIITYVGGAVGTINTVSNTPAFDATNTLRLGMGNASEAIGGDLSEVIITKKVPTVWQRRQLQNYLQNRWRIYAHPKLLFGTDLAAWYDANELVYEDFPPTDLAETGEDVFTWLDKSGYGVSLTSTATLRPVYNSAAGYLAKPGIVFTAANGDFLESAAALDIAGSVLSIFAVVQMNTACQSSGRIVSIVGSSGDDWNTVDGFVISRKTNQEGFETSHQSGLTSWATGGILDKPHLVAAIVSANNGEIIVDARTSFIGYATSAAFINDSKLRLGTNQNENAEFFDGVIHELMIIKRYVTPVEEDRIRDYLRAKWDF